MRFPGSMLLARPSCRIPIAFTTPGCVVKSSISLLSRNPAPATTNPEPNPVLIVVVMAAALPALSTTEKWVVCCPSASAEPWSGVARSAAMLLRCVVA